MSGEVIGDHGNKTDSGIIKTFLDTDGTYLVFIYLVFIVNIRHISYPYLKAHYASEMLFYPSKALSFWQLLQYPGQSPKPSFAPVFFFVLSTVSLI
jgi:hypothetical protein